MFNTPVTNDLSAKGPTLLRFKWRKIALKITAFAVASGALPAAIGIDYKVRVEVSV
jgi:hypothetical protein